jgi:hypothetical protein
VSGTTTTTTTTNGGGGVEGITTPNTGGDVEFGAGLALLVIGGGVAFGGATLRRKKRS